MAHNESQHRLLILRERFSVPLQLELEGSRLNRPELTLYVLKTLHFVVRNKRILQLKRFRLRGAPDARNNLNIQAHLHCRINNPIILMERGRPPLPSLLQPHLNLNNVTNTLIHIARLPAPSHERHVHANAVNCLNGKVKVARLEREP